jgi:hypothetical protein
VGRRRALNSPKRRFLARADWRSTLAAAMSGMSKQLAGLPPLQRKPRRTGSGRMIWTVGASRGPWRHFSAGRFFPFSLIQC